jgi:uncharacterized protein (TIGR00251 family)
MLLEVKVVPRASKSEVLGKMADGSLKVKVAAAPEDGKANAELLRVLAEHFGLARGEIRLVSGRTATRKRVEIPDRTAEAKG